MAMQIVVPRPSRIAGVRVSKIADNMETSGSAPCEEVSLGAGSDMPSYLEIFH